MEEPQPEQKVFNLRILTTIVMIAILLSIGTYGYHKIEKHTYLDSLYFSVETLTTIGYGDMVPVTESGKIFTIFYAIFGVGIMLYLISTLAGHYISMTQPHVEKQVKNTLNTIDVIKRGGEKVVDKIPEPKDVAQQIVTIPKKIHESVKKEHKE